MRLLGIDTSCDDTGISILETKNNGFNILSNIVSSQVKLHAKYGGVYPSLAKREHQKNLVPVLTKVLLKARLITKSKCQNSNVKSNPKSKYQILKQILEREEILRPKVIQFLKKYQKLTIDAIAVTIGPGLEPCLWQGVNFAKALSYFWDIPIIPVNHIEAHLLANFLPNISKDFQKMFPAIGLVVSGGHTELILIKKIGDYKIIGETLDDAAGECFDKTARILGLGYPGGPAIAAEAAKFSNTKEKIALPRPMINSKNYDFSFSGLKTAVLYNYKQQSPKTKKSKSYIRAMANEIQQSIIDVLIKKTLKAAQEFNAKTIILGGGVAANEELRKQFKHKLISTESKLNFMVPPKNLCTDNGAMIAVTGLFHLNNTKKWQNIEVNSNLKIG